MLYDTLLKESMQCKDRQTFSAEGRRVNTLKLGAMWPLLQLLTSAVVRSHTPYVTKGAWLCSSKTLFIDAEAQRSCDFTCHELFFCFFSTIKNVKASKPGSYRNRQWGQMWSVGCSLLPSVLRSLASIYIVVIHTQRISERKILRNFF